MNNGAAFTGGAGDDTFIATAATLATNTLNAGDNLTGGEGTDTLSITASTACGNTLGTGVTTSSVEGLSVNAVTTTTVDATLMSGLTDIYSNGSLENLIVSNVASIPNTLLLATNKDVTVGMTAATTVGTADEMTVALNGVATSGSVSVNAQGIEKFNVIASGTASGSATTGVSLVSTTLKDVAITGTARNIKKLIPNHR